MNDLKAEIEQIMQEAEILYTREEIEACLDKLANEITASLHDKNPVILCSMLGAVIVTGKLMPRLNFPLQLDYIHATRYKGETSGGALNWIKKPDTIKGRTVLIVDDILDEGITLKAVVDECENMGAEEIYTAVLLDKEINKPKAFAKADFTGLTIPDKYVFGYGMDYKEYWRNCDAIYAVKDS